MWHNAKSDGIIEPFIIPFEFFDNPVGLLKSKLPCVAEKMKCKQLIGQITKAQLELDELNGSGLIETEFK